MLRLMLVLIFFALVAAAGVWLGPLLQQDTSYVLIALADYTIEMRLPVLLLLIVGTYLLLWISSYLLRRIMGIGRRMAGLNQRWTFRKMRRQLLKGWVGVAEGEWKLAEKNMIASADSSPLSLVNYLLAAQAAQEQGALERRDQYLQTAYQQHPDAQLAIGLTQAQLAIAQQQYESALASLTLLHKKFPKNNQVLKVLFSLYQSLQDWRQVVELLPLMEKRKLIDSSDKASIQSQAYLGYWTQLAGEGKINDLINVWQHSPSSIRFSEQGLLCYAQLLHQQGRAHEAAQVLQKGLEDNWQTSWLALYARIEDDSVLKRIHTCERWLVQHPQDSELLYLLAQLCAKQQLWGKAVDYLVRCIERHPSVERVALLSFLYEQLGESTKAQQASKRAIQLLLNE